MLATTIFTLSLLQSPWPTLCHSPPQYGYNGPGVYRIISKSSSLPIGFNISTTDTFKSVVSVAKDDNDDGQRWLITELSKINGVTTVGIISDGTGDVMSSTPFQWYYIITAKQARLSRPEGRWVIDTANQFYSQAGSGKPIRFNNVGVAGYCLNLEQSWGFLGARILNYPYENSISDNEVWLLECLEAGCQAI